jgi:hypothetical protein
MTDVSDEMLITGSESFNLPQDTLLAQGKNQQIHSDYLH